ncbi:MAG TPA: CPBP family intramembrane glutamic endopeptidase [Candidatus Acidoferrum sp.]|nr:CPBP family intramembrane glutamic endopeptidase [Candidatus Acidoferrum sp.]
MEEQRNAAGKPTSFFARHPIAGYFALTYFISWAGAFLLVAHKLVRGESLSKLDGILMFPVMLLGPSIAGIALTRLVDGKAGLTALFARMRKLRVAPKWFLVLLIPPALVLGLLLCLKWSVSSIFSPNYFLMGVLFGVPAGFFEEIGWTGFVYPKMKSAFGALAGAVILGLFWGGWHIPVIDYLGSATPHGAYWLPYFLAFTAAMTAMRLLISWLYVNTESVLLAQLLHVSSTGSLVIFSPSHVSPAQETAWYLGYAALLWVVVGIVSSCFGKGLKRSASASI